MINKQTTKGAKKMDTELTFAIDTLRKQLDKVKKAQGKNLELQEKKLSSLRASIDILEQMG